MSIRQPVAQLAALVALVCLSIAVAYLALTQEEIPEVIYGIIAALSGFVFGLPVTVEPSPGSELGGEEVSPPPDAVAPPPAIGTRNEGQSVAASSPHTDAAQNRQPARNERRASNSDGRLN